MELQKESGEEEEGERREKVGIGVSEAASI